MCGRFTLAEVEALSRQYGFDLFPDDMFPDWSWRGPRFNIAPSQRIATVVAEHGPPVVRPMHWGFQPGWLKPSAKVPPPINARAETLTERSMFRGAVAKARCLIPADGFYEWQTVPGRSRKQPMYIRLQGGPIFTFAGLYVGRQDGDATIWSCAIVTTMPNALMAPIHNRMPVILDPDAAATWLDASVTDSAAVVPLLEPYPAERMEAWPIGLGVNTVRNDGPELIARVA